MHSKFEKLLALLCAMMLAIGAIGLAAFADDAIEAAEVTEESGVAEEKAAEEEAAKKAAEEEAAKKAAEEEAAKKAAEEAAKRAAEEEAAKKAAEEEAAKKAAEEETAKKAAEEAAKKAAEEEAAKKAAEEEAAKEDAEEETVKEEAEEEASEKAEEEEAAEEVVEEKADAVEEETTEDEAETAKADEEEHTEVEAEGIREFEIDGDVLLKYNGTDTEVAIPDGVKEIGRNAFAGNRVVGKVIIADSVEVIAENAFKDCINLKQVIISDQSKLTKIEKNAFVGDLKLDIAFAKDIEDVSDTAFEKSLSSEEVQQNPKNGEETVESEEAETVEENTIEEEPADEEEPIELEEVDVGEEIFAEEEPEEVEIVIEEALEDEAESEPADAQETVISLSARDIEPPVITSQPQDVTNAVDQQTGYKFTVGADGTDIKYRWQVNRGDGKGFVDLTKTATWNGSATASLNFIAKKGQVGFTFRVRVYNDAGEVYSDPVQVSFKDAPVIAKVSNPIATAENQKIELKANVTGATSYQWQIDRNDGKGYVALSETATWVGTTTNALSFTATEARRLFTYRLIATNASGTAASNPVTFTWGNKPVITVQPVNSETKIGDTGSFTVKAEMASKYRWQVDRQDGNGFVDLTKTATWFNTATAQITFICKEGQKNFWFRVRVSNDAGDEYSEPVRIIMGPEIETQPENQIANAQDEIVSFTVGSANTTSYQWQVDRGDGKGFVNLSETATWMGVKTSTLSFKASEARRVFSYRAMLTNKLGSVYSEAVTFSWGSEPVITIQPVNSETKIGDTGSFKVTAEMGSKYRWQVDRQDGNGFVDLTKTATWFNTATAQITFICKEGQKNFRFRVRVSNDAGEVYSEPVRIIMGPEIEAEPEDQIAYAQDDTVEFTIESANATSYQWQVDRGDGKGFVNLSETKTWVGVKTKTLSFTAVEARRVFSYRVVVTNKLGSVNSEVVKFAWGNVPEIVSLESITAQNLTEASFVSNAKMAESYQWQVDRGDEKGWQDLAESNTWKGTTTGTLKFTVKAAQTKFQFRVIAKNSVGETPSDPVTVSLDIQKDNVIYELIDDEKYANIRIVKYNGTASSLTIPEKVDGLTVKEVGEEAFMGNTKLKSIDLPDTIEIIRARAFKDCTSLAEMK